MPPEAVPSVPSVPPRPPAIPQGGAAEPADPGWRGEAPALRRQRILVEASQLFFEKGYQASTLDALAKRLDITKPSLYVHYRSKSQLLAEICETGIKESLAALERGVQGESGAARQLQAAIEGVGYVVIRFQYCVAVYQREMKALDRRDAQHILQQRHHFDRRISLLLDRGVAEGSLHVSDSSMASVWIGGLLSWIPVWYIPGGRRSEREVVDNLVAAAMRLVGAEAAKLSRSYTLPE
jgi:AcrR family transcriptional regulator